MVRIGFAVAPNSTPAERQRAMAMAQEISQTAKSCGELLKYGQEHSPRLSGELRDIKIGTLPAEIQTIVQPLKIAEASRPVVLGDGIGVIMLCDRKDPPSPIPTRAQVVQSLMHQRLETLTRRYLRDIRRTAYVDMRV